MVCDGGGPRRLRKSEKSRRHKAEHWSQLVCKGSALMLLDFRHIRVRKCTNRATCQNVMQRLVGDFFCGCSIQLPGQSGWFATSVRIVCLRSAPSGLAPLPLRNSRHKKHVVRATFNTCETVLQCSDAEHLWEFSRGLVSSWSCWWRTNTRFLSSITVTRCGLA